MTSLWVYVLGRQYTDKDIKVPYHLIAISLATFVIPLGLGSWFKYKRPKKAEFLRKKILKPFFATCLIVLPIVGTLSNLFYFYLVTWKHLLAGLLLGGLGYGLGGILAYICQQGESV